MKLTLLTVLMLLTICGQSFAKDKKPKESLEDLHARYDLAEGNPKEQEIIGKAIDKFLKKRVDEQKKQARHADTPSMKEARKEVEKQDKKELNGVREEEKARHRAGLVCPDPNEKLFVWINSNVTRDDRQNQMATFIVKNEAPPTAKVEIHTVTGAYPHHNGVPVVKDLCPGGTITLRQRAWGFYDSRYVQYMAVIQEDGRPVRTELSPSVYLYTSGGFYTTSFTPPVTWVIGEGSYNTSGQFAGSGASSGGVSSGSSGSTTGARSGTSSILGAVQGGMAGAMRARSAH